MEFKLTIADTKKGKSMQKTITEEAKSFIGLKIGDTIKGETIDMPGYEFEITGGSDYCGFPMRKGISGARKRVLIGKGVGYKGGRKGMRIRKTVCGEAIHEKTTQINIKTTKYGNKPLTEKPTTTEGETPTEKPAGDAKKSKISGTPEGEKE